MSEVVLVWVLLEADAKTRVYRQVVYWRIDPRSNQQRRESSQLGVSVSRLP